MTTLTFPDDILPASAMFGLQSNTESFVSPLNRATQTVERPGALWKARLTFTTMSLQQQRRLKAVLASLNGMAGRVYLWPHAEPGSALYSPLVNGAMTDFKVLPTKSWPASTLVMRAGEYLEVNGELKMVTADVTSNGSGQASVPVAPPFRKAPANNAPITLDKPKAFMRLASDVWEFVSTPAWRHEAFSVDFIEVPT
ncbi:hypothetical protein HTY52_17980 [Cupriavidus taiwanensis]|uniref:hypothetical protein n=1 Tax=Cupriavidus taiwanensis TaxID=164546 RepID=UPI001572A4D0|nr:hypothetical protein [Cupriavidus taiwanensis]NSX15976.1 hypothetical protein [Cupriavidus taiwanensis]